MSVNMACTMELQHIKKGRCINRGNTARHTYQCRWYRFKTTHSSATDPLALSSNHPITQDHLAFRHTLTVPHPLDQLLPKSLPSRTHPVTRQTSETSMASLENARYRKGQVSRAEHPNKDRHFILDDGYCKGQERMICMLKHVRRSAPHIHCIHCMNKNFLSPGELLLFIWLKASLFTFYHGIRGALTP